MDDQAERMPEVLTDFQRRMMLGLPQLDPLLERLPENLSKFYEFYDPLCANSIIASTYEYLSGTVVEVRKEMMDMTVHRDAVSWPYFLREKTGIVPPPRQRAWTRLK